MIQFHNISKSFGNLKVIDSLSLELTDGQTHIFLGPSGCGKSTILKTILGLVAPDSGDIQVDGERVVDTNLISLRKKIGYVVQEAGLFPHLTGVDNVCLMARQKGRSEKEIQDRLVELCELVGLDMELMKKYPKQMSGGQRQRVGLMRALMLDPEYLLLDEPLGALDPIVRFDLQEQLKVIFNKLKKTVIIVTHDIAEAAYFGHTITLFNHGKIAQHGTFEELVKNPADDFVVDFFKSQRPPEILKDLM